MQWPLWASLQDSNRATHWPQLLPMPTLIFHLPCLQNQHSIDDAADSVAISRRRLPCPSPKFYQFVYADPKETLSWPFLLRDREPFSLGFFFFLQINLELNRMEPVVGEVPYGASAAQEMSL